MASESIIPLIDPEGDDASGGQAIGDSGLLDESPA